MSSIDFQNVVRQVDLAQKAGPELEKLKKATDAFEAIFLKKLFGPNTPDGRSPRRLRANTAIHATTGPSIMTLINFTKVPICVLTSPAGMVAASTCGTA